MTFPEPATSVATREIEPDDYDRVGRLLLAAYDATGTFTDEYRRFLSRPDQWVGATTVTFVAEAPGQALRRVIGVAALALPGDAAFETPPVPVADSSFRFLAVDPDAQRNGAGRALVRACVAGARERGSRRMVIHSMWFMTAAHRLYENEGFVRRPDLDLAFPKGVGYAFQRDLTDDADDHFPPPDPVPDEPPWFEDVWQS